MGFLEIFIGDLVRLRGSTQLGQPGRDAVRLGHRRQDTDGGLAVAQLRADAVRSALSRPSPLW